jgi:hypothetical protein
MKREGLIYSAYTLLGLFLTAYLVNLVAFGSANARLFSTVLVLAGAAAAFALLTIFYAVLCFVFLRNAVHSIERTESKFVLSVANGQQHVLTDRIRLVRSIGAQFSWDEAEKAFAVFVANRRLWVCTQGSFVSATQ